jgi:hypothetical protein
VAEGYAPVVAVLLAAAKKSTRAHVGPQRRRPPGTLGHLSCKPVVSGGAAVGARMVIMDPGSWA